MAHKHRRETGGVTRFAFFVGVLAFATAATAAAAADLPAGDADAAAQIQAQDARRLRVEKLRAVILGSDRAARIAAFETVQAGDDAALRRVAVEAALDSRDPVLGNLVLRQWLSRLPAAPVLLYATKEDPGSVSVLQNLGPLTLKLQSFDAATGAATAQLSAPGYDMTRDGAAAGTLAQTTLTFNTFGCQLALQLSEHRTLDGLYRCRSLPVLVARVVPD